MKLSVVCILLFLPAVFMEPHRGRGFRGFGFRPMPWLLQRPMPRPRPHHHRPQPRPSYGSEVEEEYEGECYARGDPHYKTFDGKKYNFMGLCEYIHTTDFCGKNVGTFKVIAQNYRCGRHVSCIRSAKVIIKGHTIRLQRGTYEPAPEDNQDYSVTKDKAFVVVKTKPKGLTVKWDRKTGLYIYLTREYRGKVCGLCGNFDGRPGNDFRGVSSAKLWAVQGKGRHCTPPPNVVQHPCEKNPERQGQAMDICGIIRSDNFKSCKDKGVDTEQLYQDCVFDACQEEGSVIEDSCQSLTEAVDECEEQAEAEVSLGKHTSTCKIQKCDVQVKLFSTCEIKCCVFPFTMEGKTYTQCVNSEIGSWCSSEENATPDTIGLCV